MTDPVEALKQAVSRLAVGDPEVTLRDVDRLIDDAVPTGDAGLDVERVHAITCKNLIEHEPGSNKPWRWPCYEFAAEYARLSSSDTGGHQHRWVDARNEAVTSGEVCPDCGAIRASDTGGRG